MPISHVVLFKVKPDHVHETKRFQEEAAKLKQIEGVIDVAFNENFSPDRAKGYRFTLAIFTSLIPNSFTHVLSVTMASREVLPIYADHPVHVAFAKEVMLPVRDDILAVDFDL